MTERITAVFELATERAVLLFSVVRSVFKVSSFDVNVPKAEIARFVLSTFLVIWDCATDVSALTSPVTKLFRSIPDQFRDHFHIEFSFILITFSKSILASILVWIIAPKMKPESIQNAHKEPKGCQNRHWVDMGWILNGF